MIIWETNIIMKCLSLDTTVKKTLTMFLIYFATLLAY